MTFEFEVLTEEARAFCEEVLEELTRTYGLSRTEALQRMNKLWRGQRVGGPDELVYHELPEYWAQTIYKNT